MDTKEEYNLNKMISFYEGIQWVMRVIGIKNLELYPDRFYHAQAEYFENNLCFKVYSEDMNVISEEPHLNKGQIDALFSYFPEQFKNPKYFNNLIILSSMTSTEHIHLSVKTSLEEFLQNMFAPYHLLYRKEQLEKELPKKEGEIKEGKTKI